MKPDPRALVLQIVAVAVLGLTVQQTMAALQASGSWQRRARASTVRLEDPYSRLDGLLTASKDPVSPDRLRNPFVYVAANTTTPAPARKPVVVAPPPPVEPPRPALTSIIWDKSDPQATIRYDGRDYSVHERSLFSDFSVTSISPTQVVLDRNGESIVLTLRPKGD